ncbi:MAG: Rieske 2Fe-2S domain-containing protein [Deltaproteobacteria bacterium]|nr:Rieske 2Fe-2S domain-containing protein [Deltaproteobacteria bacterium]
MPAARIVVCKASSLRDKQTVKFAFDAGAGVREGFVIALAGRVYAYRNQCRHIPMTMDWVENRFLSRDRCHIQCATHGALYEIDSGLCVSGPPAGQHLRALPVAIEDGKVVVTIARDADASAGAAD